MAVRVQDDWKCTISVNGGPSARMALITSMQLSRVKLSASSKFVCVQRHGNETMRCSSSAKIDR